jgi:signal transduction histidine kinase
MISHETKGVSAHLRRCAIGNPFLQWSIKTRMTLFTLAIFVVSIWSLTFYATRTLRDDMQGLLGDQQFSTVTSVAKEVDDRLRDRLKALELIAGEIDPALLDKPAALQARLEQRPLLQILFNGGTLALRSDGTAIASFPLSVERQGVNYMDRDFVMTALMEGRSSVGRPVVGKKLLAPVFVMAAPIHDAQGKIIGVLAGVTDLSRPNFLDMLIGSRYGKTGGYLLNAPQYRLIVTASDKSRIMQALPATGINTMLDRYMQGYEGYGVSVNSRGVEELTAAKGIPSAGWILGVVLPTEEAFSPIKQMQQRMFIAALILTLLAGSLTWWMIRRQLSSLAGTVQTLARLTGASYPLQALEVSRQDEIGELVGAFNRLLETLGQRDLALKASEAFTQAILNAVASEIAVLDREGVIVAVNEPWQRFALENSGATGSGVGSNYLDVCHLGSGLSEDGAADAHDGIRAVINGRLASFVLEYPCHSPKEQRWFSMSVTPLGEVASGGAVVTHSNITGRKLAELEIKRSNAELEQFSYSISHDMRQPLRMISSYLQLLEMGLADQLDSEKREYFNFAIEGAKRLDAMLSGLLEYSRVGRKGRPPERTETRAALDEALRFLQPAIAEAQARVSIEGDWPQLLASPDEIVRLLQNLIDNAVKFRAAGRVPEITISSRVAVGGLWRLSITDNGVGIFPEQIGRLFQVFQRLQSRADYEGTGIGLALCRKIAEHHGGRIWVESAGEGQGCQFYVELPLEGHESACAAVLSLLTR